MGGADYLEGLPPGQASGLTRVNEPGLTALRGYLADGTAVAFLGAGVSRPLYPLWTELIGELVSSASSRLTDEEAATCLMLARESPEEVVDGADRYAAEAIAITAPRGLVPAHCAGLAARVRIRASQVTSAANPDPLFQGRDAADAALHLAVRHQPAWHELDSMRAHALLDRAEGINRGWAAKADALHKRLVPPGLDPDPLATVERLVAEQAKEKKR